MPSSPTSQSCLMGPRHPPRGAAGGSSDCLKLESSSAGLPGPESSGERALAPASFYVPLISDQTNSIVNPAGSCLICPEADESAGRRSHCSGIGNIYGWQGAAAPGAPTMGRSDARPGQRPHPPQAGHLSTLALASGSQHSHPQTGLCRGQARLRVPGSEHGPHWSREPEGWA